MSPGDAAAERFSALARELSERPDVSRGRMFGSEGLKVAGKVFAFLVKGRLVVKLPAGRVDELVARGVGTRFDPGHGRLMKEWVAVDDRADADWLALADAAREFVATAPARR